MVSLPEAKTAKQNNSQITTKSFAVDDAQAIRTLIDKMIKFAQVATTKWMRNDKNETSMVIGVRMRPLQVGAVLLGAVSAQFQPARRRSCLLRIIGKFVQQRDCNFDG
jgi:hypothetical protein